MSSARSSPNANLLTGCFECVSLKVRSYLYPVSKKMSRVLLYLLVNHHFQLRALARPARKKGGLQHSARMASAEMRGEVCRISNIEV